MRAYLIDAAMRRIIEFDYNREHDAADEILGCDGPGGFTLGSGPLAPPRDCDSDGSGVEDYNVEDSFWPTIATSAKPTRRSPNPHQAWSHPGTSSGRRMGLRVILSSGFRLMPTWNGRRAFRSGRGLIIGVTIDGDWCSARISLEQLTARVSFARRKLRGVTARRGIIPGEMWFGPVAPVTEELVNSGTWTRKLKASPAGNVVPLKARP